MSVAVPTESETEATPSSELERLRGDLVEKDELVALLTDRLEQAVERLDRFKREGVRANTPSPTTSISLDVERLVSEWDEAGMTQLGDRIDDQFASLRVFLSEEIDALASRVPASPIEDDDEPTPGSDWESVKARLMSEEEPLDPVPTLAESELLDVPEEPLAAAVPDNSEEVPPVDPLPEPPDPVELDDATTDELVAAVTLRDRYIIALTQRALDRRLKLQVPTDWALLRGTPGELVKNVQRLHDELDDAVRMAEVQLCLERAKLSREKTELEALRAELAAADEPKPDEPEENVRDRRWRRMLGGK